MLNVIWTDDKYFWLNPHQQNDGIWPSDTLHDIVESNNNNYENVAIFVDIVDGKAPILHPFGDENGRNVIVNTLAIMIYSNEVAWPTFRSSVSRNAERRPDTLHKRS